MDKSRQNGPFRVWINFANQARPRRNQNIFINI